MAEVKALELALGISLLVNVGLVVHVLRGPRPETPIAHPVATSSAGIAPGLAERLKPIESQGKVLPSAYEQNEVRNTLTKRASPPIQVCFKALTDQDPTIRKGRVEVDWQILPSGQTVSAEVVTSDLPRLDDCIVRVLGGIEFPPPPTDRPVYVSHAFLFKAEDTGVAPPVTSTPSGATLSPSAAPGAR